MGRGALGLLLSVGPVIMKVLWVTLLVVLVLFEQSEAKKKPSKPSKPSKGKPKPKPSCLKDDEKLQIKKGIVYKYHQFTNTTKVKGKTVPVANQPCWWDLTRTDCAQCINGGVQCGFPMHKWCQDKKEAKKSGCKGITQFKYTKSMTGYPCYRDLKRTDCAWCLPEKIQCGESKATKCGSFCKKPTDMACNGVPTTCKNIPKCGFGAACDQKTKECKCGKGMLGNGYQCFDKETGEAAANPKGNVDISIESASQFFVFPNGSPEFPIAI